MLIRSYFQHVPPFPGACSRRIESLIEQFEQNHEDIFLEVYTSVKTSNKYKSTLISYVFNFGYNNKQSYILRFFNEILIGIIIGLKVIFQNKPNLFLLSVPNFITCVIIAFFLQKKKIKYLIDLRDMYPLIYSNSFFKQKFFFINKLLETIANKFYQNAKGIICTNDGIIKYLNHLGCNTPKLLIFNGFPDIQLRIKTSKYKKFTICFHGVLGSYQDIDLLVKTIKALNKHDVKIVVIGYGKKEKKLIDIKQKNLTFYGKLSLEQTLKIVSKCHVGLSFRTNDYVSRNSFPVKNWEYLGFAIPSINYPATDASNFCKKFGIGFEIKKRELVLIVNKIIQLQNNSQLYNLTVNNCINLRSLYTRSKMGIKFYKTLIRYS